MAIVKLTVAPRSFQRGQCHHPAWRPTQSFVLTTSRGCCVMSDFLGRPGPRFWGYPSSGAGGGVAAPCEAFEEGSDKGWVTSLFSEGLEAQSAWGPLPVSRP